MHRKPLPQTEIRTDGAGGTDCITTHFEEIPDSLLTELYLRLQPRLLIKLSSDIDLFQTNTRYYDCVAM